MNTPDPRPTDEQLAALLAAADKDAPPPDRAFLDRLREQSLAGLSKPRLPNRHPTSLWKRIMIPSSLRWIAASAAAVLVVGIVFAHWLGLSQNAGPRTAVPMSSFVVERHAHRRRPHRQGDRCAGRRQHQAGAARALVAGAAAAGAQAGRLAADRFRGANAVALKLVKAHRRHRRARTPRSNWSSRPRFGFSKAKSKSRAAADAPVEAARAGQADA